MDSSEPAETLEIMWRDFEEQLRRRARTRLRQYGLTGQAESMDICNEVMADLIRSPADKQLGRDEVLAYILRAIDNQVIDTFRTLARQCRDFRRNESTPVDELPMADHDESPSQVALRREVLQRIESMLAPTEASAVRMMLENRGWKEIGEALSMPPDTARMRVRRAIQRVRATMTVPDHSVDLKDTGKSQTGDGGKSAR
ncbi:MAG: sigma-70 family RNA polymerase sigma factor [Planctomycetota bacterium]